jgi:hypothetical protein
VRADEAGLGQARVRSALARLGADTGSAPEVPAAVTSRISAAMREARQPPAHSTAAVSSPRFIALVVGIGAVVAAVAVGIAMLLHTAPAPRFPTGPTAEKMTVSPTPADTPKPVVTRP